MNSFIVSLLLRNNVVFSLSGGEFQIQAVSYLITLSKYTVGFKDFPKCVNPLGAKFLHSWGKAHGILFWRLQTFSFSTSFVKNLVSKLTIEIFMSHIFWFCFCYLCFGVISKKKKILTKINFKEFLPCFLLVFVVVYSFESHI